MAGTDYIPREDANFSLWAQAFSNGISADPAKFMLTAAQASSIAGTVTNFVNALLVATTPETRTKGTVAAKVNARSICESLCRQYAIDIKNNEGITDEDKIDIGVRPINPDREPIDVPTTSPLINVLGNLPGTQTLRYADTTTPDSGARPFGASELQLFLAVTDTEDPSFSEAQFYGKFTRNPIEVDFTEDQDGKIATYYARWASPRGEVGPLSVPISFRIAA